MEWRGNSTSGKPTPGRSKRSGGAIAGTDVVAAYFGKVPGW